MSQFLIINYVIRLTMCIYQYIDRYCYKVIFFLFISFIQTGVSTSAKEKGTVGEAAPMAPRKSVRKGGGKAEGRTTD